MSWFGERSAPDIDDDDYDPRYPYGRDLGWLGVLALTVFVVVVYAVGRSMS